MTLVETAVFGLLGAGALFMVVVVWPGAAYLLDAGQPKVSVWRIVGFFGVLAVYLAAGAAVAIMGASSGDQQDAFVYGMTFPSVLKASSDGIRRTVRRND